MLFFWIWLLYNFQIGDKCNYSNISVVLLTICLEIVLSMELHLGAPLSHSTGKSEVHSHEELNEWWMKMKKKKEDTCCVITKDKTEKARPVENQCCRKWAIFRGLSYHSYWEHSMLSGKKKNEKGHFSFVKRQTDFENKINPQLLVISELLWDCGQLLGKNTPNTSNFGKQAF